MQPSDLFAYLAAFVTIVLAIALSDLMMSTHRLLRARARVRWSALPLLMASFVYFMILSEFFGLWSELQVRSFAYIDLVGEMIVPSLISLLAFAVLPDDVPGKGLDLRAFYFAERRYLVVLLALIVAGDIVRNLLWLGRHGFISRWEVWAWFGFLGLSYSLTLALIWRARSDRAQLGALVTLNIVAWIAYFQWLVEAKT
jgi:hypothetical protein